MIYQYLKHQRTWLMWLEPWTMGYLAFSLKEIIIVLRVYSFIRSFFPNPSITIPVRGYRFFNEFPSFMRTNPFWNIDSLLVVPSATYFPQQEGCKLLLWMFDIDFNIYVKKTYPLFCHSLVSPILWVSLSSEIMTHCTYTI